MSSGMDKYRAGISELEHNPLAFVPVLVGNLLPFAFYALAFSSGACEIGRTSGSIACHGAVMPVGIIITIAVALFVDCWFFSILSEVLADGKASLGSSLGMAGRRFPAFIGTMLLISIIIFGEAIIGMFAAGSMGLVTLVFVVPAYLATFLFLMFAPIAAVYNEFGPLRAMEDSIRVVRHSWRDVLSFLLFTFLLYFLFVAASSLMSLTGLARIGFMSLGSAVFQVLIMAVAIRIYAELSWKRYEDEQQTAPQIMATG